MAPIAPTLTTLKDARAMGLCPQTEEPQPFIHPIKGVCFSYKLQQHLPTCTPVSRLNAPDGPEISRLRKCEFHR